MAFDWHDYIQVEDGPDAEAIRKSLDEMAQTPEGRDLIKRATERVRQDIQGPEVKIRIMPDESDSTGAYLDGTVRINSAESIGRVKGVDGKFHDLSIQGLIFHELVHLAERGELGDNERPTIEATNAYMRKYYGEPERDPLAHGYTDPSKIDLEGTHGWDWNPNFDRNGNIREIKPLAAYAGSGLSLIEQFRSIDRNVSERLSPEMQSLWEKRDNAELFEQQLRSVLRETDKDELKSGIDGFSKTLMEQILERRKNDAGSTYNLMDKSERAPPVVIEPK